MGRAVIIGGAKINNYPLQRSYIRDDDFVIYCDCGLKHMNELGRKPDLIVGDFDSHENPNMDVETIVLPREKDDTDSLYAVKTALSRGFTDFLLVGVIGARLDHTIGNLGILVKLRRMGMKALAVDDFSELSVIADETVEITDDFPYFSLLNITGRSKGITVTGAKFPLENYEITPDFQIGVSNEVIKGEKARVTVADGELLLIKIITE